MLTAEMAETVNASDWFQDRNKPYMLLDTTRRIRAVNPAYQTVTAQPKLVGELLFDAFPDNPADFTADGVSNLSHSLESVFSRGISHSMGVQRYDVPDPDEQGAFLYKVWAPVNSPIRVNGKLVAVLHHVQDITAVLAPTGKQTAAQVMASLRAAADELWRQFPELTPQTALGMLADSGRVVLGALGYPNLVQSQILARLRLEARTGHLPAVHE